MVYLCAWDVVECVLNTQVFGHMSVDNTRQWIIKTKRDLLDHIFPVLMLQKATYTLLTSLKNFPVLLFGIAFAKDLKFNIGQTQHMQ